MSVNTNATTRENVRRLLEAVRSGEELDAVDRMTAGAWLDNFDEVFPLAAGMEDWERPESRSKRLGKVLAFALFAGVLAWVWLAVVPVSLALVLGLVSALGIVCLIHIARNLGDLS